MAEMTFRSKKLNSFKAELKLVFPKTLFHVFYICFSGLVGLYLYRPMKELDFFWRIILGESLTSNVKIESNGLPTWGNYDGNWKTTQPLGEVLLSNMYKFGGLELVSIGRIAVWTYVAWWIFRKLLIQKRSQEFGFFTQLIITIYALTSVFLFLPFIQERPQTIFLILLAFTGHNLIEIYINSRAQIKATTWLTLSIAAFIHPGWVIIYTFILFHFGRSAFQRKKIRLKEYVVLIVIPVLPILGPSGVNYYSNLIEISRLGRLFISEWQPLWRMDMSQPVLFLFGIQLFLVIFLGFHVSKNLPINKLILFFMLLTSLQAFAILAVRNIPISMILSISLLSVVINSPKNNLDEFENLGSYTTQKFSNIERIPTFLKAIPMVLFALSLSVSIKHSFKATEDFTKVAPLKIIQAMSNLGTVRVLNSSNEGGYLHYFGGTSVYPFIDGRIDRYDRKQLDLLDLLFSSRAGANELVRVEFKDATEILIPIDAPLRPNQGSGFRFICQENGYVWYSRQIYASCSNGT